MPFEYLVELWPVLNETMINSRRDASANISLVAHPSGHISVQIRTYSKSIEKHFQRLSLPVGYYVKIALAWKTELDDVELFIGGHMLETLAKAPAATLGITRTASRPTIVPGFSVPENVPLSLAFEHWLFVETLSDLTKRLSSKRRYDGLRISALVRQLLKDGNPLMDQANRESKTSITFRVRKNADWGFGVDAVPEVSWNGLQPVEGEEFVDLKKDEFLAARVIFLNGTCYSALQVISAVANVMGGVHLNKGSSEADNALVGFAEKMITPVGELIFAATRDIGLVTLCALLPLARKLCGIADKS